MKFNSALFTSFRNIRSVLGLLVSSTVWQYLNSSGRTAKKEVLVAPVFGMCHLFIILMMWKDWLPSDFANCCALCCCPHAFSKA